jgi:hypothetical protein
LEDLSTYDLAAISMYLEADQIALLWMCGFKLLNVKLTQGGVAQFAFKLKTWRPIFWPPLLASLNKVSYLRVEKVSESSILPCPGFDWNLLSQSLVTLKLEARLEGSDPEPFGIRSVFPSIKKLEVCYQTDSWASAPNFAINFPNLTSLGWSPFRPWRGMVHCLQVNTLPPSLTALHGSFGLIEFSTSDTETASEERQSSTVQLSLEPCPWPSGLVSIDIRCNESNMSWIKTLPSSLETLAIGRSEKLAHVPVDFSFPHLPRLQTLKLPSLGHELSDENIKALPRGLTTLSLYTKSFKCRQVGFLPPSLTSFRALVCDSGKATVETFAQLPRSLTYMPYFPGLPVEAFPFIPNTATNISCMTKLPESHQTNEHIKTLQIQHQHLPVIWPPNLTQALIYVREQGLGRDKASPKINRLNQDRLRHLPPSLKLLVTTNVDSGLHEIWESLPRGLASLSENRMPHLEPIELPATSSSFLPSTMEILQLQTIRIIDDDWFAILPVSLTRLTCENTFGMNLARFSGLKLLVNLQTLYVQLKEDCPSMKGFLQHLPCRLVEFDLLYHDHNKDSGLEDDDLKSLPPGILTASLSKSERITRACLILLPAKYIQSLRIGLIDLLEPPTEERR